MSHLLTKFGEEYVYTNDITGATWTIGLYNDATDTINDGNDYAAITTEPTNANYTAQVDTCEIANPSGNKVVARNTSSFTFDFSDQTDEKWVDSYYVAANFQATIVVGDSSATDHLVYTGALTSDRELGSIDTLQVNAGEVQLELE